MTKLDDLRRNWEIYGEADPMWSVLMAPDKLGGRWEVKAFLAAGEREISTVLRHLRELGVEVDRSGAALDFGCGPGRLTQALAARFASAWGVDISAPMIALANELNRYPATCRYLLNTSDDLAGLQSGQFAFVYTSLVLQHIDPAYSERYLAELARVLAPGGTLVFQLPDRFARGTSLAERVRMSGVVVRRSLPVRRVLTAIVRRLKPRSGPPTIHEAHVEMHCMGESRVREIVEGSGLRIIDVRLTNSTDLEFNGALRYLGSEPKAGYVSKQYCALSTR